MFEAIFSYRAPLYKLPHRKCALPICRPVIEVSFCKAYRLHFPAAAA